MSDTNDSGSRSKHPLWLENNVWSFHCCSTRTLRSVTLGNIPRRQIILTHSAEGIVNLAFDHVTQIYNTRFGVVISQGAFADLIVCLTEFSKNLRFQKKSLQAIEALKSTIPTMLKTPECPLSRRGGSDGIEPANSGVPKQLNRQTQEEQFWFPVLFAFHDVLMTGDDLEVRSRYVQ